MVNKEKKRKMINKEKKHKMINLMKLNRIKKFRSPIPKC